MCALGSPNQDSHPGSATFCGILSPLWMLVFSSVQEGDSPLSQGAVDVFWLCWVFAVVQGLLIAVVSLVVEPRL